MPTTPLPWQRDGYAHYVKYNGRVLIAWSMGLGKTYGAFLCAHRDPDTRPVVVVCPASLKGNWARDASTHFGIPCEILERTKPPSKGFRGHHPFVIINYEILHAWMDWLKALNPQLVIGDEIQKIRDPRTRNSKMFKRLCEGVPNVIALSGTPMVNRHREMFPICNILWPKVPEFKSFRAFANAFCKTKMTPWGLNYDKSKDGPGLHKLLLSCGMHRVLKKDVLKDLPPNRHIVVPLEIEDRRQYNDAVTDFIGWLSRLSSAKARRASHAQAVTKVGYLLRLTAQLKLKSVIEWIDTYFENTGDKLAIGVIHHDIVTRLHERYPKNSLVIDGQVKPRDRLGILDRFHREARYNLLIGNIEAAGVGLNYKIPTVALGELPWTPGAVLQFCDRIHGIGRGVEGKDSSAYFLLARGTIEEKVCQLLQDKSAVLTAALDGEGSGETLDIMDMLIEEMAKQQKTLLKAGSS